MMDTTELRAEIALAYTKIQLYCLFHIIAGEGDVTTFQEQLLHLKEQEDALTARPLRKPELEQVHRSLLKTYHYELTLIDNILKCYPQLCLMTDGKEIAAILREAKKNLWTMSN